jgi:transposase
MDLPHSDWLFRQGVSGRNSGSLLRWPAAFDFFGGMPQLIPYDNTKLAVAKIVKGGKRLRSKMFAELQSHYFSKIALGDRERAMTRAR